MGTVEVATGPFGMNLEEVPRGSGSGFLWDSEHVVTNFHVIQNANRALVTMSDQSVFSAKLVGAEPDSDLAVLRLEKGKDARTLVPLEMGRSGRLRVGQRVFAIGNP